MAILRSTPWGNNKPPVGWRSDARAVANLGIVGAWLFNEGAGGLAFDSIRNNTATITGGVNWTAGRFGGPALKFDASSGYLNVTSGFCSAIGTGDFVVSMWVYPTSFTGECCLFDSLVNGGAGARNDAFVLVRNATTGTIRVFSAGTYRSSSANALVINQWNHVVHMRSAGVGYFFLNGVLDTTTFAFTTNCTSGGAVVGKYADTSSGFFAGLIDAVSVSFRASTVTQLDGFYRDPFSWMQPIPRRAVTAPAAPVGGARPWIYQNTNVIVGGGTF